MILDGVKIKPCPFCGGEPKVRVNGTPDCTDTWVECSRCFARTDAIESIAPMRASAIHAWNQRADTP